MNIIKPTLVTATCKSSQRFGDKYLVWFRDKVMTLDQPNFQFTCAGTPEHTLRHISENLNLSQIKSITLNFL